MNFICRIIIVGCLGLSSIAQALEYGSGFANTQWDLTGSVFECRFYQPIEEYGIASFYHRAGEDLTFQLQTRKNLMKPGMADISVLAPYWRPSVPPVNMGQAKLMDESPNISLDHKRSNQFLHALLEGMQPTIVQSTYYDVSKVIQLQVSALHFDHFYKDYLACVDQLLPMNFDQVAKSKVRFIGGEDSLGKKDLEVLDRLVFYTQNDPRVFAIYIDGHTDSNGRRYDNRQLSKRRAEWVERYLIKKGLDPDMITVRYHGSRYPIASNKTASGRAKNRRVTVRLEQREDMEIPEELLFKLPETNQLSQR